MASPISPVEAIQIIQKAVALYKKVRGQSDEIDSVGKRMEGLNLYLGELQALISDKHRNALATLRPAITSRLQDIIKEIRKDASEIYSILEIWDRSSKPAQVLFSLGKNPNELKRLSESIEQHKMDLYDILQLMGLFAIKSLHGSQVGQIQSVSQSNLPHSAPQGSSYNILFVDPSNLGRSKVAEAYTKLVREWTTRTGGTWRINVIHSAGIKVRNRSDCVDMLQSLQPPIDLIKGNQSPNEIALASLFDNKYFNYLYKVDIAAEMLKSRSRGITQNMFKTYDFILVFVGREYETLLRFKQALIAAKGPSMAPNGKGRTLHLGAYLSKDDKPIEIVDAPKEKDGSFSRSNWNTKTGQIKLAIKAFLTNELAWQKPGNDAPQS